MAAPAQHPVLVYDRIGQNRRRTWLLLALAVLLVVPGIFAASFWLSKWLAVLVAGFTRPHGAPAGLEALRLDIAVVTATALLAAPVLLFLKFTSSSWMLALSAARPPHPQETEAGRILENLSIGAGLPAPRLFVIDSMAPNAFAAGLSPAHSFVAVTQGLLRLLDRSELEGVMAHELSHIGNRDTRLNTIAAVLAVFLRMPYLLVARPPSSRDDYQMYPGLTVVFMARYLLLPLFPVLVCTALVAPALGGLLRGAISRGREFLADADAALLTRNPQALSSALAKIRGANLSIARVSPAVSHLYFADPFASGVETGVFRGRMFSTHPSIESRIAQLNELAGGVDPLVIDAAQRAGAEFAQRYPQASRQPQADSDASDETSFLTAEGPTARVYRVAGCGAPVFAAASTASPIIAELAGGSAVLVFEYPGEFREVVTATHAFGYLPASVELEETDMAPPEIFGPAPPPAAPEAGLSDRQVAAAVLFGLAVFATAFVTLVTFAER